MGFWLQQQATPDLNAKWQYYVSDGVDGKKTGWYPYDPKASDEVEEIYSQHVANARDARTSQRIVASGYFKYQINLDTMTQTNQRTSKVRTIRRAEGAELNEGPMRKGSSGNLSRAGSAGALKLTRAGSTGALKATRGPMKALKVFRAMKAMKKKKVMKAMKKKKAMKAMKKKKLTPKQI